MSTANDGPTSGFSTPEGASADTRSWALVATREVRVKLTDRNFVISTGVTLLLIVGLLAFQAIVASNQSVPDYTVAVTSGDGETLVSQAEAVLQEQEQDATLASRSVADVQDARAAVTGEDVDAMLTRQGGTWTITAEGAPPDDLRQALAETVRLSALTARAEETGSSLSALLEGTELQTRDLSGQDGTEQIVRLVAGLVFGVLFYMASLTFGISIAQSVVEEKQSRIVEILAAVIPVRSLLAGKVLGNTLLAFGQMALVVGVALIGLSFTQYDRYLPMMTQPLLWYLPFFIAGFVALACMWAAAGALASRVEDLQSTTLPLSLTLILIFVVALRVEGVARQLVSFVPVMSTIVMPMRLLEGDAAWWEPVAALIVTVAFCYATVTFGGTLYRRALMQTQGRVTIRKALASRD